MKPSDRIFEIAKQVAAGRQAEAKTHPSYDFLAKVSGMVEAEQLESLEREPRTLLAAIVAYLDEQAGV
jgi:hypothetical protein